jgi:transcriptional regulator with XRE-family HTH domain
MRGADTFTESLFTMRKRAGIRIDDFALIAGVSKQFMTDLENGKPTVQMGKVLGLLQRMAIGVSLDLSDDAIDRYTAELEKATSQRTLKKAPNGKVTAGGSKKSSAKETVPMSGKGPADEEARQQGR